MTSLIVLDSSEGIAFISLIEDILLQFSELDSKYKIKYWTLDNENLAINAHSKLHGYKRRDINTNISAGKQ